MLRSFIRIRQKKIGNNHVFSYKLSSFSLFNSFTYNLGSLAFNKSFKFNASGAKSFILNYDFIVVFYNLNFFYSFKNYISFFNFILRLVNCFFLYSYWKFNFFFMLGFFGIYNRFLYLKKKYYLLDFLNCKKSFLTDYFVSLNLKVSSRLGK